MIRCKTILLVKMALLIPASLRLRSVEAGDTCSSLPPLIRFSKLVRDHVLEGRVISSAYVSSDQECQMKCILSRQCDSFNLGPQTSSKHYACEVLDRRSKKTKTTKNGWKFRAGKCQTSPCLNGGTCYTSSSNQPLCACSGDWVGASCDSGAIGWYSYRPGHTCKQILESWSSKGDGEYWIDPEQNGNPLKAYCDMTTDGGGWLLVSSLVIDDSSAPPYLSLETAYRGISNYHKNKMFLTKSALNELRTYLPFTQLRFHCSKQHHGRTFHVTTATNSSGEAVVQYFSGQTDVQPDSCGSFVRMDDDYSLLATVCHRWGYEGGLWEVGKWGTIYDQERLYIESAVVDGLGTWLLTQDGHRIECDDYLVGVSSSGDFLESLCSLKQQLLHDLLQDCR